MRFCSGFHGLGRCGPPAAALALLAATLAFAGCTRRQPYRVPGGAIQTSIEELRDDPAHRLEVEQHSVEVHDDFTLGFVEFDDQGYFAHDAQLERLLEAIRAADRRADAEGTLIVVFVHGWQHNASVCDQNVACFREVLRSLGNLERLGAYAAGRDPRRVFGVYLGWRGRSIQPGGLRQLSFYARKSTAHRVGRGRVLEVLTRLEGERDRQNDRGENRSRLVVVGHSFGGAVVFSAISGIFQDRAVRSYLRAEGGDQQALIDAFGDLIVLVNPAFEASLYAGLHDLGRARDSYARQQPTILVTVSSETDSATGTWFPLGRRLGTLFQKTSGKEQHQALTTTLGNFAPYRTHRADLAGARGSFLGDVQELDASARGTADCRCDYISTSTMEQSKLEERVDFGSVRLDASRLDGGRWVFGPVELAPVSDAIDPYLPFYVVGASDEIVTEHNGIYNEAFLDFLRTFLLEMERRPERWGEDP